MIPSWFVSKSSKGVSTETAAVDFELTLNFIILVVTPVNSSWDTSPFSSISISLKSWSGVQFRSSNKVHKPPKKMAALDSGLDILSKSFKKTFAARSRCSRCLFTPVSAIPRMLNSTCRGLSSSTCMAVGGGGMINRMSCTTSSALGGSSRLMKSMPICKSSKVTMPELSLSNKQNKSHTFNFRNSIHSLMAQSVQAAFSSEGPIEEKSFVNQAKWFLIHLPKNKKPSTRGISGPLDEPRRFFPRLAAAEPALLCEVRLTS
mmetsp:Transcript_11355/g.40274  ORF Transcript_11355/g.40274 Transcript_11355/m.40274 type:complete len:261 (-) Transcript_11355:545-1327(-)